MIKVILLVLAWFAFMAFVLLLLGGATKYDYSRFVYRDRTAIKNQLVLPPYHVHI